MIPLWNEPKDHPADFARFQDYCDRDVETEISAARRMVPLSDEQMAVYHLNERINDRGILVDLPSVRAAIALCDAAKARLDREMTIATGGYVTACTQTARLAEWVGQQGVSTEKLAKADLEHLLAADDLPDRVRVALTLRQEAAKASVAKLEAMEARACADGRIRGSFMFAGAGTGRFSSVGVQFQNLPRPRPIFNKAGLRETTLYNAFRTASPDWLTFLYGDELGRPLHLVSDAIRGFLIAAPGHDFVAVDYSSIEGRVNAWLSGEEWVLDAYRANDAGTGPGLYELTAGDIFDVPVAVVTKDQRQVGKLGDLSLGYQGGVSAFLAMARGYGVRLDTAYPALAAVAAPAVLEGAEKRYEECLERKEPATLELTREGWLAAELVKVGWRAKRPNIVGCWKALDEAVIKAVSEPGAIVEVLKVRFLMANGFLWMQLPSGRCLAYGAPRFAEVEVPWADKTQPPEKRERRRAVTVCGVDSQTKRWVRYPLYGGILCENAVQAIALDLLVNGLQKAEAAGYPVVAHIHDEVVSEVPEGFGSVADFAGRLCDLPAWADGLPLKAAGWRGKRYRKD